MDSVEEMYMPGSCIYVEPQGPSARPFIEGGEGAIRSHFFRGVLTVVSKLFNVVRS